jgi:hypothetical protein
MNKSILKTVAVSAVAVMLSVGCSEKDGGGGGEEGDGNESGIVGDWSVVSIEYVDNVHESSNGVQPIPDDYKWFYSLKSSNDLVTTQFSKVGDFWIESVEEVGKYSVKGDSVCVGTVCNKYIISGNNLTFSMLGEHCWYDDEFNEDCHPVSQIFKTVRGNLASTRSSLGTIYSQDSKLKNTEWEKPSSDPECEWCGDDRIAFWSQYFYDYNRVYIPNDAYDAAWYTEGGNRLTLVAMECDGYETVKEDEWEWEECVSYAVSQTITLDYQLTNGTLRLKAPGKDWDTWTPRDNYMYKSKAKSKQDRRHVNPFKVSWK